jgi:hypothetical protein
MTALAELTGQVLGQAVHAIAGGGTLYPILCADRPDRRQNIAIGDGDADEALAEGRAWIEQPPVKALRAVLVYDGYINRSGKKKQDALVATARTYNDRGRTRACVELALPYEPAESGFVVGAPHLLKVEGIDASAQAEFLEAFWKGVKASPGAGDWATSLRDDL